jgi:hypothetical protein
MSLALGLSGYTIDYDVLTVGEAPVTSPEEIAKYVLPENHELQMMIQFEVMYVDQQGSNRASLF